MPTWPVAATTSPPPCSYIRSVTGAQRLHLYGISSGALKAAMYAAIAPSRSAGWRWRPWSGPGRTARPLIERRKKLPQWLGSLRRPMTHADIHRIFTRDREGLADPATVQRFAEAVLALDSSIPNGTYVDMCSKPRRSTLGDHGAHADPARRIRRHRRLAGRGGLLRAPTQHGQAAQRAARRVGHGGLQGHNHHIVYHLLHAFFSQPDPLPLAA